MANPHPKAGPGRPKGSKNKVKILRVDEALAELGIEPVHQLIRIIGEKKLAAKDEARIWMELLSYCHPKPRDIEPGDSGDDDGEDLSTEPTAKLLAIVRGEDAKG